MEHAFKKVYNYYKQGLNAIYCKQWGGQTRVDWVALAEDLVSAFSSFSFALFFGYSNVHWNFYLSITSNMHWEFQL